MQKLFIFIAIISIFVACKKNESTPPSPTPPTVTTVDTTEQNIKNIFTNHPFKIIRISYMTSDSTWFDSGSTTYTEPYDTVIVYNGLNYNSVNKEYSCPGTYVYSASTFSFLTQPSFYPSSSGTISIVHDSVSFSGNTAWGSGFKLKFLYKDPTGNGRFCLKKKSGALYSIWM